MALSGQYAELSVSVAFGLTKAITSYPNPLRADQSYSSKARFTAIGASANQFSELYSAIRTLAGGANETLDLYGSLTNQLGETINFARVKVIVVELLTTTAASSITVGNAASNVFTGPLGGTTPTVTIANGGGMAFWRSDATGWTVTNSSTDNLKVLNNDGAVVATYRITLIGSIT